MQKLVKVAITGGIGSGKSTFACFIRSKGYQVINADMLAKELYDTNEALKQKIIEEFGTDVYPNGKFDRVELYKKAFADERNVQRLNEIVHPVVIEKISDLLNLHRDDTLIFVEAALVFEAGMENLFDYVVLITADEDLRTQRAAARENISGAEIKKRMHYQLADEKKKERADFTFYNNGSKDELEQKSNLLLQLLIQGKKQR